MTIGSLMRVLVHRWYLTLVVVALVAWAARGVWNQAEPEYETSATFLVTPSVSLSTPRPEQEQGTQPGPSNPFSLSGGASTLAATVSTALNTAPVQAGVLAAFPEAGFAAGEASSSSGNRTYFPVVVTTTTPEAGPALVDAALQAASQQLLEVQQRVQAPADGLFIVIQSTPTDGPRELYPDRARAVGAIALGGLAAGIVLIVLVDLALTSLSERRRRRAAGSTPATSGTTSGRTSGRAATGEGAGGPDLRDGQRGGQRAAGHRADPVRERAGSSARSS
ncbi:hypothetical protein MO973_37050 [Paenibacillus sp. TRM 82003]|uniref:hypothetical protein n=1 Tax=Kineococcus sp. TRM81007 TaxID=2925831 RepID=UPI001F57B7D5|nr:hypothetical protein [Kineococcus sp. TRM81007]MCI2239875.1 hypothetical protein [Kineococcus sp. TRM81007]MCI3925821.1 hypothetical protein [Paenibacillus sp. TRM 82003]